MPLKVIESGGRQLAPVNDDGTVTFVHEDGSERRYDVGEVVSKLSSGAHRISELNSENRKFRIERNEARTKLSAFGSIEPEAARKAVETVRNIDDGKLMDTEAVEKVKNEAVKAVEARHQHEIETVWMPYKTKNVDLTTKLHEEMIGGRFARSQYIAENLAQPVQLIRDHFGKHFSIDENNELIAKDAQGNEIFSKKNPKERASFDEAMQGLVDASPYRDHFLKSKGKAGTGAPGGAGGASDGKTKTTEQFLEMSHDERHAFHAGGGKIVDSAA